MSLAVQYFKFAADQNHATGQLHYGLCLRIGLAVHISFIRAGRDFKLAADQSHFRAEYWYSVCLVRGEGVLSNLREASSVMKRAADAGLPAARRRYACFFEYRIGVRVNLFRALALYECYKKTWNSSAITGFGLC